jgi:hypothetical protein
MLKEHHPRPDNDEKAISRSGGTGYQIKYGGLDPDNTLAL